MLGLKERAEKGEISEYETHLLQHAAMKPLLLGSSSSTCAFCSLKRSLALQKTLANRAHVFQRPSLSLQRCDPAFSLLAKSRQKAKLKIKNSKKK